MNLLKGDFPDATCYTASYWERHIPEAILERSGLAKQVQEKFEEECGRRDAWDASLDEYPLSNGNGEKPSALPEIPEEHRKWWDVARGQLQLEMPSAAFNTWVRDTQLVSTEEDTFTIATKNKYACDWLENRLKSTLERLLTGGMMQKVQVNFVIR